MYFLQLFLGRFKLSLGFLLHLLGHLLLQGYFPVLFYLEIVIRLQHVQLFVLEVLFGRQEFALLARIAVGQRFKLFDLELRIFELVLGFEKFFLGVVLLGV